MQRVNPLPNSGGGAAALDFDPAEEHSEIASLFELLEGTPYIGALVVGENGHVAHIDQTASEMLMRADARYVIGRAFDSAVSPRMAAALRLNLSEEPRLVRAIVDGWQLVLTVRRAEGLGFEMIVQRRGGIIPNRVLDFEVRFLPCGSLGSLGVLSSREVEVAALIGMGLSVREIGERFSRSIKTVENHRVAIGRKLGVSDRLDIAMIAYQAGLRPEDVGLERL